MNKTRNDVMAGLVYLIGGASVLLIGLFGPEKYKDTHPPVPIEQKRSEVELKAREYVSTYGYAINPRTRAEQVLVGLYGVPHLTMQTIERDTLEFLAGLLYNDLDAVNTVKMRNYAALRGFKPNEPLPAGIPLEVIMFEHQLGLFQHNFPDRYFDPRIEELNEEK